MKQKSEDTKNKDFDSLYIAVSDLLLTIFNDEPVSAFTPEVVALHSAEIKVRRYFSEEVTNTRERLLKQKGK